MDCHEDDARKAKEIAEKKFHDKDLEGARKMALKAQRMYPDLEGLSQFMAVVNVNLAASADKNTKGLVDYYKVLDVGADAQAYVIKKQYRKLALLLHPDKNYGMGAERAFKLVAEAWAILSDETKKALYDKKRSGLGKPFKGNGNGNGSSCKEHKSQRCPGQSVYAAASAEATARFLQGIFQKMERKDFEQGHNQAFNEVPFSGNNKRKNTRHGENDDDDDDCVILEDGFGRKVDKPGNDPVNSFPVDLSMMKTCGEEEGRKTHNSKSSIGKLCRDEKEDNMAVPDSDFYDFDGDRAEDSFEVNQIWAAYDDEDGMPRFYARIRKISSLHPFKVQVTWLEALHNNDPALIKWHRAGFYKGCGDFKFINAITINSVNVFSHIMRWERSQGVVKIMPRRGDVWALYRDWSSCWDASTPQEIRHKYLMVEVLSEFVDGVGIDVVVLVKVGGYRTLFQKMKNDGVTEKNMLRFSHKVPAQRLKGNDVLNIPRGCWELDPAALPAEMVRDGPPEIDKHAE